MLVWDTSLLSLNRIFVNYALRKAQPNYAS